MPFKKSIAGCLSVVAVPIRSKIFLMLFLLVQFLQLILEEEVQKESSREKKFSNICERDEEGEKRLSAMKVYVVASISQESLGILEIMQMDLHRKKQNRLYERPATKEDALYFPVPNWELAAASQEQERTCLQTIAVVVDIQLLAQALETAQVKLGK
jgi:hypothetical protein